MKTKSILIALLAFVMVGGLFAKDNKKETTVFSVEMDCEKCQKKIEKNIAFEKGVKAIDVNLEKDLVTVTYAPKKTDVAKLKKGFEKIGYKAVEVKDCCPKKETEVSKSKESDSKAKKEMK